MRFTTFTVAQQVKHFFLDRIEIDPSGVIRVVGWSRVPFESKAVPRVYLDRETVPFVQHYRVTRPDVESTIQGIKVLQAGLLFEYIVPESMCSRQFQSISVDADNRKIHFAGAFEFINPHYRGLFDSPQVYHRENIYGSGPPNSGINSAVLALAQTLEGPV